jgi:hypothetical protein
MSDDTPSPLNNVITIDDERIKSHLERVARGTAEEGVRFSPAAAGDCRSTFFRLARGRAAEDGRRPISAAR